MPFSLQTIGRVTVSRTALGVYNRATIAGASIIIVKTTKETLTDFDGKYLLSSVLHPATVNIGPLSHNDKTAANNDTNPIIVDLSVGAH